MRSKVALRRCIIILCARRFVDGRRSRNHKGRVFPGRLPRSVVAAEWRTRQNSGEDTPQPWRSGVFRREVGRFRGSGWPFPILAFGQVEHEAEGNGMKDARQLWFRPDHTGWDPRLYERFFDTLLGGGLRAREESTIYDFLGDVLERSHFVLEVGCGTGNYTVPVAHHCAKTVAVDASPEMLRYTRGRLDQEGLSGVETRLERLPGEPAASQSFDGTLAIGVLNYIKDLEGALKSLTSSLKPGGWAVFNVPARSVEGRIYALAEFV